MNLYSPTVFWFLKGDLNWFYLLILSLLCSRVHSWKQDKQEGKQSVSPLTRSARPQKYLHYLSMKT